MSHDQEHRADPRANQEGYIKANDFAVPYLSKFSAGTATDAQRQLLAHVNCGYLSTRGVPPTLLALKQHAQSLCNLIRLYQPPPLSELKKSKAHKAQDGNDAHDVEMVGDDGGAGSSSVKPKELPKFPTFDPFDWLESLDTPYENEDGSHNRPLVDIMNVIHWHSDIHGTAHHCPLQEHKATRPGQPRRPYADHANLMMHANDCLERLDHEYSTTGGLLSVLPTDQEHDVEEMRAARNTLTGQWLMYTQALVGRMHELEIAYGNAADALGGEAVVPLQHASLHGPDARTGGSREIAFPQDRWVLVNAGDDVFGYLHTMLDRQEALAAAKEKIWREDGSAISERAWMEERGGKHYARGIVPLTVATRYYRLKGAGHSTIFVCPAWDHHPGTAGTRDLEARPTVVSVVAPKFPERLTEMERRFEERHHGAEKLAADNLTLRSAADERAREAKELLRALEYERRRGAAFERSRDADKAALQMQLDEEKAEADKWRAEAAGLRAKAASVDRAGREVADRIARAEAAAEAKERAAAAELDKVKAWSAMLEAQVVALQEQLKKAESKSRDDVVMS
jgi:hypothetical protein